MEVVEVKQVLTHKQVMEQMEVLVEVPVVLLLLVTIKVVLVTHLVQHHLKEMMVVWVQITVYQEIQAVVAYRPQTFFLAQPQRCHAT